MRMISGENIISSLLVSLTVVFGLSFIPAMAESFPDHILVDGTVIKVSLSESVGDSETGESSRFVPGFQVRGFTGDVKRAEVKKETLALGFHQISGSSTVSQIALKLINTTEDLVVVSSIQFDAKGTPARVSKTLSFPIELDMEETRPLILDSLSGFKRYPEFSITLTLEDNTRIRWIIRTESK